VGTAILGGPSTAAHRVREYIRTLFNSELRDFPPLVALTEKHRAAVNARGYPAEGIGFNAARGEEYDAARLLAAGLLTPVEIDRMTLLANALGTMRVLFDSFFQHTKALAVAANTDVGSITSGMKSAAETEGKRIAELFAALPAPPIPRLKDLPASYPRYHPGGDVDPRS
jgi:hypothetical protein